jgi:hypothetical protein
VVLTTIPPRLLNLSFNDSIFNRHISVMTSIITLNSLLFSGLDCTIAMIVDK